MQIIKKKLKVEFHSLIKRNGTFVAVKIFLYWITNTTGVTKAILRTSTNRGFKISKQKNQDMTKSLNLKCYVSTQV